MFNVSARLLLILVPPVTGGHTHASKTEEQEGVQNFGGYLRGILYSSFPIVGDATRFPKHSKKDHENICNKNPYFS